MYKKRVLSLKISEREIEKKRQSSLSGRESRRVQIHEFPLSQDIMIPDDIPVVDAAGMRVGKEAALLTKTTQACPEIKMGAHDSPEIFEASIGQEFHGRYPVEEDTGNEDPHQAIILQVLVQHDDVVPDVEICFLSVVLGKGSPADMKNPGSRADHDAITPVPEPPAKVDLLHMGKEFIVEPTGFMITG